MLLKYSGGILCRRQRFIRAYAHFAEKQGFGILITICVAVITGTAVWGRQEPAALPSPVPVAGDVSAAGLMQQTLNQVTASPVPAHPSPAPFAAAAVLRGFSPDAMVQSGVTGVWRIHDAVDLQFAAGADVPAFADGVVSGVGEDALLGHWVRIQHGDAEALYAGLSAAMCRQGDAVQAGTAIGQAGNGVLDEADLGPHLHLRITRDGKSIDPMGLLGLP